MHAPDREVRRHCCVSDPRRATPSIRTNLDFGSDTRHRERAIGGDFFRGDFLPPHHATASNRPVPTANPKQLTDARESVDSPIDERSLQIDLVRLDRAVPATGRVRSRKPCPSASAQRAAAQIPEARSAQQHRPAIACRALSPGSRGAGRTEDYKAGDAAALAPCRLPSVLALEIPSARWPAADNRWGNRPSDVWITEDLGFCVSG